MDLSTAIASNLAFFEEKCPGAQSRQKTYGHLRHLYPSLARKSAVLQTWHGRAFSFPVRSICLLIFLPFGDPAQVFEFLAAGPDRGTLAVAFAWSQMSFSRTVAPALKGLRIRDFHSLTILSLGAFPEVRGIRRLAFRREEHLDAGQAPRVRLWVSAFGGHCSQAPLYLEPAHHPMRCWLSGTTPFERVPDWVDERERVILWNRHHDLTFLVIDDLRSFHENQDAKFPDDYLPTTERDRVDVEVYSVLNKGVPPIERFFLDS